MASLGEEEGAPELQGNSPSFPHAAKSLLGVREDPPLTSVPAPCKSSSLAPFQFLKSTGL